MKFSPFIVYGGPSYDPITQVFENSFTDLTGLESLEKIGGDLILQDNRLLSSLDGLENLNSINGSLKLHDCDLIENLVGFKNIELINEGIEIGYNYNFKNFEGLERISKTNSIYVYRNHSLFSFKGLESLNSIDAEFSIVDNDQLKDFKHLNNLESIQWIYKAK